MKLVHHFLIAMPAMQDSRFKRTVIYVCEHNEDGAMGMIINKPRSSSRCPACWKSSTLPSPRDATIRPTSRCWPAVRWRRIAVLSCTARRIPLAPAPTLARAVCLPPRAMCWRPRAPTANRRRFWLPRATAAGARAAGARTAGQYTAHGRGRQSDPISHPAGRALDWRGEKLGVDIRNMPCNAGHA